MNILFQSVVPLPLLESDYNQSEVWGKEITFRENGKYLVLSPSGSGKSTLLAIIYGMRHDYNGQVLIENGSIKNKSRKSWAQLRTSSLSIVFQGLNLFDELTSLENIEIKNNLTHFKTRQQIKILCEKLQISDFLTNKVAKLSFGQKQRVAIVRALCQPFHFLLLDEPFSHLDNENTQFALKLIFEEAQMQEAGVILTSVGNRYDGIFQNIIRL
jgi:ABC-type lipoprotein export system ATPase subunit